MGGPLGFGLILKPTEVPIMSFQTDLNGTFNPTFTIASGTLRWVIDGEEQITNTPSKALTGSTVDVEVFANGIADGAEVTAIAFDTQNIIGELSFEYFTINGSCVGITNPGLTSVVFSTNANAITGGAGLRFYECNLSSLDLSNVTITATLLAFSNSNLTSITFSGNAQTSASFDVSLCDLSSLDLSDFTLSGLFFAHTNSNLTSITFSTNANTSSNFRAHLTNLSTLDLSNFTFSDTVFVFKCSNLTSLTFSNTPQTVRFLWLYEGNFSSLDISMFTVSDQVDVKVSPALVSITHPSYTTLFFSYLVNTCALNLATVNSLFAGLNTFFSANAPGKDLDVKANLGTNASPTGGSSNTDLVNLRDVVYPNAGFTFTPTIN